MRARTPQISRDRDCAVAGLCKGLIECWNGRDPSPRTRHSGCCSGSASRAASCARLRATAAPSLQGTRPYPPLDASGARPSGYIAPGSGPRCHRSRRDQDLPAPSGRSQSPRGRTLGPASSQKCGLLGHELRFEPWPVQCCAGPCRARSGLCSGHAYRGFSSWCYCGNEADIVELWVARFGILAGGAEPPLSRAASLSDPLLEIA